VLDTARTATVEAVTPCEVFVLGRREYEALVEAMPLDRRLSPLKKVLVKFWELMQNENHGRAKVDYAAYLQLHLRLARTLSDCADDFDEDEQRADAQAEWREDCERAGLKVTAQLDRGLFNNAMYQLVDLWAADCHVSYAKFLSWCFDEIAEWAEAFRPSWRSEAEGVVGG
jgi:CRP-like cAMP-binding protein